MKYFINDAKRAKEIGIELWTRISKNKSTDIGYGIKFVTLNEMRNDGYITSDEYLSIRNSAECPLCAYFYNIKLGCSYCPLRQCMSADSPYEKWVISISSDYDNKQKDKNGIPIKQNVFARQIVKKIKEWNV